jgi:RNA polymerase sigma factor (sigma-70 family)
MRYSTSPLFLTVILLDLSASPSSIIQAFVQPTRFPPHRLISLKIATRSLSQSTFKDILQDNDGRINPELAQRIWRWERQQRLNLNLPDFQSYSTRDGLRWVKEIVDESLGTATTMSRGVQHRSPPNYDDLIQEGVFSLMQSFKTFEHDSLPNESFEDFAKANIRRGLQSYSLERAKGTGTGPSSYMDGSNKKHRRPPPLSMESTVEIADPLETERHYFNQDEWDVREGLMLDDGKSREREELVKDYLDETLQYEGEDQMWIHEKSVAAPLRDSIPESTEDENLEDMLSDPTSPDDLALTDMILYNVDDFLGKTLDEIEVQVIQMRFGLDDGIPKTQKDISFDLGLTVRQVRKHQKRALEKLRTSFTDRYASDHSSHEDFWEDTV